MHCWCMQKRGKEEQAAAMDILLWAEGQDWVKQWRWINQVMIGNSSIWYDNFLLTDGLPENDPIRAGIQLTLRAIGEGGGGRKRPSRGLMMDLRQDIWVRRRLFREPGKGLLAKNV